MTDDSRNATVWERLAAPIPEQAIQYRPDGKPVTREGRAVASHVAYVEAGTVRERLDAVVPGEWDLTLELLPALPTLGGGEENDQPIALKARLQVLGVIREDVGNGRDYKQAATDAFKRAAVRFGIGHELYAMPTRWVPANAADRPSANAPAPAAAPMAPVPTPRTMSNPQSASDIPACPKCGGKCWDNRFTKRNAKAPDFKCRDRSCDGVVWPSKATSAAVDAGTPGGDDVPISPPPLPDDDLPF